IAAAGGTGERPAASILGLIQFPNGDPHLRQVESEDALHERIAPGSGNAEGPLEYLYRALVVTQLRVEHADVVEDPRNGLFVVGPLERAEAVGVARFGGHEISAHVKKDAAVLLNHSQ